MPICAIYTITHLDSGKMYIGSSNDVDRRWKEHKKLLKAGKHHSRYLQHAWSKYGGSKFSFDLLEECEIEFLLGAELFWLNALNTYSTEFGYNVESTPSGAIGLKRSRDTREKMRKAALGRTPSPETRLKLSIAGRRRVVSEETKKKLLLVRSGWTISEKTKNKVSVAMGGRPFMATKHSSTKSVGIFNTLRSAANALGVDPSNIRKCLIGKARKTGGYNFLYLPSPQLSGQV